MPKKSFIYSDLSKKQLDNLKEIYIQQKVSSMSIKELKNFVQQIITHQITDTIDKEEETEAWREMSDFFDDQFETIISDLIEKYPNDQNFKNSETDLQKERVELLEKNNCGKDKRDMWDD